MCRDWTFILKNPLITNHKSTSCKYKLNQISKAYCSPESFSLSSLFSSSVISCCCSMNLLILRTIFLCNIQENRNADILAYAWPYYSPLSGSLEYFIFKISRMVFNMTAMVLPIIKMTSFLPIP
jgi:hypothetical protein